MDGEIATNAARVKAPREVSLPQTIAHRKATHRDNERDACVSYNYCDTRKNTYPPT